ncbi:MAG: hypothetical protein JO345_33135 [Streptosporangiaceae bacterium]|nr:hypothetical protein [Streptosporangiaceae bacterium]
MDIKRLRWTAATGLLAILVIIAVVLTISSSTSHQATGTKQPSADNQAQACPASSSSDAIPTAPPADLRWKNVGPMLVPTSATAGPMRYQGSVWECYAHSPMGAVIAAYDIFASLASPDWRTAAEHEIAPGPGEQAFIAAGNSQTYQAPAPGQIAPAVGFEILSYTPQQATIEALASAGDGYQADERTVAWVNGDWKMVLTPDGKPGPDTQLVTSADGFVLWGSASNG